MFDGRLGELGTELPQGDLFYPLIPNRELAYAGHWLTVYAVEAAAVKLVDQFPIFELGGALKHLSDVSERDASDPFVQLFALWAADAALSKVLNGDQTLSFCRGAALDLLHEMQRLQANFAPSADGKPMTPLPAWEMTRTKSKIEIFEHQLSAELKRTASYAVPLRGIFNIELLAEHADRHIHETIRHHLSEFAVSEYREAGRCLAFGLYSASGFHSARAVEDVLRVYYERFIGPPPDKSMGLLASNLNDLLSKADAKIRPRENTVRHIRDVTNFDRNPLMHRNVKLEEIDATTLFNSALGVIVEMVKELISLDDEDLQAPLPLHGAAAIDLGLASPPPRRRLAAASPKQIPDISKSSTSPKT
ncbi:hypothetical protein [Hyphomicrobium sp. DY-1]|uniref:hypothetical protein n=1 Tax=Hyphomicrobium sp. DY-1 TaxID=3075650 RepID=UPI0039C46DF1